RWRAQITSPPPPRRVLGAWSSSSARARMLRSRSATCRCCSATWMWPSRTPRCGRRSWGSVEDERRPVEGMRVLALGADEFELRLAQRLGVVLALFERAVHVVHHLRSGAVTDIP